MTEEELLRLYHAAPGKTVAMLDPWRDREGRSSYERLAQEIDDLPRTNRILDLACGDGYLLSLLAKEGFKDLIGVDRSPDELSAARERLGPAAALLCQDAHALPLPAGSVDAVTCHMALMLLEHVDAALAEIARVLRPGGLFIAVINRAHPDPAYDVYRRELYRITAEVGLDRLRAGDPRAYTSEGLRELLRSQPFDGEPMRLTDFVVEARATPQALWAMLRLMYDVFRLPAPAQATFEDRLLRRWQSLTDERGQLTCAMGMRLLKCRTHSLARQP
jgi:ubiquinone/menaquinone biosynthesis C-methylase UbiE